MSKFEIFCQIFSVHSTSCIDDRPHDPANRNLIKREIFIIIYIESERENKSESAPAPPTLSPLSRRIRKKII